MDSYAGIARRPKRSRRLEKLLGLKIGEEYKFDFYWNVLLLVAAVTDDGCVCTGFPELEFVEGDK